MTFVLGISHFLYQGAQFSVDEESVHKSRPAKSSAEPDNNPFGSELRRWMGQIYAEDFVGERVPMPTCLKMKIPYDGVLHPSQGRNMGKVDYL